MISLKNPKQPDNVLSHWFVPMDGVQFSTVDFYNRVEESLADRKVPRLRSKRVAYHEGGSLSDRRLYLRLARERFSFEVCAAPFGTGYFFSLRFVEVPRGGWISLILLLLAVNAVLGLFARLVLHMIFDASGWFWIGLGVVDVVAILSLVSLRWRTAVQSTKGATGEPTVPTKEMPDFDAIMLGLPVIGEWYERRRKETYYRHDTRLMYQTVVSEVVKKHVEELTAAKGVKLLRSYDHNPFLTDFYTVASVQPATREGGPPLHGVD